MGKFTRVAGWVLVAVGLVLTVIAFVDGPELPDNAATLRFAPLLVVAGAVLVTAGVLARAPDQPSGGGAAPPQPPAVGQQPYPGAPGHGWAQQPGQPPQHTGPSTLAPNEPVRSRQARRRGANRRTSPAPDA